MKPEHKELLRERARAALRDLYHNATPVYPRDLRGRSEDYAQSWFQDAAEFEVEYLLDGGAYGKDYRKTLAAECNAGRYKSEKARAYYVCKGMRAMEYERADCGALTGWRVMELAAGNEKLRADWSPKMNMREALAPRILRCNAQWERIGEFGKLYTWGRGGRTLAPADFIRQGGGSRFSIREDYADELSAAACVDLIRVLESFNAHVAAWCNGVPEMWRKHCDAEDAQALADKRADAARKAKETRERRYWEARGVCTI